MRLERVIHTNLLGRHVQLADHHIDRLAGVDSNLLEDLTGNLEIVAIRSDRDGDLRFLVLREDGGLLVDDCRPDWFRVLEYPKVEPMGRPRTDPDQVAAEKSLEASEEARSDVVSLSERDWIEKEERDRLAAKETQPVASPSQQNLLKQDRDANKRYHRLEGLLTGLGIEFHTHNSHGYYISAVVSGLRLMLDPTPESHYEGGKPVRTWEPGLMLVRGPTHHYEKPTHLAAFQLKQEGAWIRLQEFLESGVKAARALNSVTGDYA